MGKDFVPAILANASSSPWEAYDTVQLRGTKREKGIQSTQQGPGPQGRNGFTFPSLPRRPGVYSTANAEIKPLRVIYKGRSVLRPYGFVPRQRPKIVSPQRVQRTQRKAIDFSILSLISGSGPFRGLCALKPAGGGGVNQMATGKPLVGAEAFALIGVNRAGKNPLPSSPT